MLATDGRGQKKKTNKHPLEHGRDKKNCQRIRSSATLKVRGCGSKRHFADKKKEVGDPADSLKKGSAKKVVADAGEPRNKEHCAKERVKGRLESSL